MATDEDIQSFWRKAEEDLAAARSEQGNERYNTCAKLAYFACFHAAAALLLREGVPLPRAEGIWSHSFVQSEFTRRFIRARKQYPAEFRNVLTRGFLLRQTADYRTERVTETQAARFLQRATEFVNTLAREGGDRR